LAELPAINAALKSRKSAWPAFKNGPSPRLAIDDSSRRDGQCGADRGNQKGQHKTKPLILFMV
jgi:hypothetical protein